MQEEAQGSPASLAGDSAEAAAVPPESAPEVPGRIQANLLDICLEEGEGCEFKVLFIRAKYCSLVLTPGSTDAGLVCAETGFLANVRALIAGLVTKLGFGIPISEGVPSDGQKIKDSYWQHHNELAALETRETELKKHLSQDYGPNGEFITLRDRCGVPCRESNRVPLHSKTCHLLMQKALLMLGSDNRAHCFDRLLF